MTLLHRMNYYKCEENYYSFLLTTNSRSASTVHLFILLLGHLRWKDLQEEIQSLPDAETRSHGRLATACVQTQEFVPSRSHLLQTYTPHTSTDTVSHSDGNNINVSSSCSSYNSYTSSKTSLRVCHSWSR